MAHTCSSGLLLQALTCLLTVRSLYALSSCYQCASPKLKPTVSPSYWQLTGLPNTVPISDGQNPAGYYDKTFCTYPDSSAIQQADRDKFKVACTSACLTLAINDPDLDMNQAGNLDGGNLLYVRGCWDKLTGLTQYATDSTMQQNLNGRCEIGKYKSWDDNGQQIDAWAFDSFCTGDICNSIEVKNSTQYMTCSSNVQTSSRPCYVCTDDDWNCKSGQCNLDTGNANDGTGNRFCKKVHTKINDEYNTVKTCSPINPFGISNGCAHYRTNQTFVTRSRIDIEADTCFCNDKDWCNGAIQGKTAGILAVVASMALAHVL